MSLWRAAAQNLLRRPSSAILLPSVRPSSSSPFSSSYLSISTTTNNRTSPSSSSRLSMWRRKKEIGKEGLMVAKELKRLQDNPLRFDRFMKSHVSRLLKSDLVAVLAEFQRQDLVFLSIKVPFPTLSLTLSLIIILFFFWILQILRQKQSAKKLPSLGCFPTVNTINI